MTQALHNGTHSAAFVFQTMKQRSPIPLSYPGKCGVPKGRKFDLGEPLNIFAFAYLARATVAREALWDNIVERNAVPGPTEAQKVELDRRLSEHAAHPDDVVPWSKVKDSALTRIRR